MPAKLSVAVFAGLIGRHQKTGPWSPGPDGPFDNPFDCLSHWPDSAEVSRSVLGAARGTRRASGRQDGLGPFGSSTWYPSVSSMLLFDSLLSLAQMPDCGQEGRPSMASATQVHRNARRMRAISRAEDRLLRLSVVVISLLVLLARLT